MAETDETVREEDRRFMQAALAFGRRHLGATAPNPAVGALIVRDGVVVGRGATRPGGRPHAETLALADAGEAARGATIYVTLEPCSHHGATPPCADAIVAAGIARVVSALEDPDARVAGRGHARLAAAGVAVTTGVCAQEARRAHLGHILRQTGRRPMVTLKLAETADGYAAAGPHDPRLMITGLIANNFVQMARATHDAIMVGIGTALADDPLMTVRLPGLDHVRPLRIVLDGALRLPPRSRLAATARERPVLVLTRVDAPRDREAALRAAGVDVARLPDPLDPLPALAARGLTRVFSEGGPTVGSRLIARRLADEVILLTGARPLGRAGVAALAAGARAALESQIGYRLVEEARLGPDLMRRWEKL